MKTNLCKVQGNHPEVDGEDEFVQGNHPEVDGEDEFVQGNHPEVDGEDEFVQGDHPEVDGEDEFVQGNHPEVDGEDEFVQGDHPEVDGEDEFVQGNHPEVDDEDEMTGAKQDISNFMETLQDLFLKQYVTEPTRYRHREEPSLLDLIITNEVGMVEKLTYHSALGDSDHYCMKFKLNCNANTRKRNEEHILNYYREDYKTSKSRLGSIDWEAMLNGTIKDDYQNFVEQLHLAAVGCIPNRISPRKNKNLYMTTDALRLKNRKHLLWERYIHTK